MNIKGVLGTLHWVNRDRLRANDYNPNKVSRQNLDLLLQSILTNGWTLPIVVREDYTIIDGFHRWLIAGEKPLNELLENEVPVVIVAHKDESENIFGTITHNRARGVHLLEPMKAIVKKLIDSGKTVKEIGKQLGMKPEEIFRLSDFSREEFLDIMVQDKVYSKAMYVKAL
jgi:ParB-like chromosome segregation protein Spo0J